MKITLRNFGIAKEICGGGTIELELPEHATAGQLKQLLVEQYPRLGGLSSFLLGVNQEFAEEDTLLNSSDEIAIIPPVSGG